MPHTEILVRKIIRRNPFQIEKIPWLVRVYRYPFEKWSSHGQQALFGIFNISFFLLYQRFGPIKPKGSFILNVGDQRKRIFFDGRNTQFEALYRSAYAYGYEPELTALVDILLPSDGVYYDVGSNWGYLSISAATRPGFRGKVHAFEPFPSTFADLQSIVNQAGLSDRIQLHNQAVSDQPGTTGMHLANPLHSGWATMDDSSGSSARRGTIPVTTLDSLKIAPPTVLKIDAERAEAKVLKGAKNLIAQHHPFIIFESLRNMADVNQTLEPLWILQDAGYSFFRLAWMRTEGPWTYFLGEDSHAPALAEDCLALVPMEPEERFLSPDWLDVFACHRLDLPGVRSLFEPLRVGAP
jgi:FkbM family methyltransferase